VVAGGTATLCNDEAADGKRPLTVPCHAGRWHSIFGFQANGVGIELKSEVVFMQ
jgi:hypothetical protein